MMILLEPKHRWLQYNYIQYNKQITIIHYVENVNGNHIVILV